MELAGTEYLNFLFFGSQGPDSEYFVFSLRKGASNSPAMGECELLQFNEGELAALLT